MYAKCGAMERARAAFEEMPGRDVVTWNTLLTGYARNGLGEELLKCFAMMREDPNVSPDAVTYVCVLKGCGLVGCLEMGEAIGAEIRKQKLSEKDTVLGTALLDMYCKCGAMEKAREVFDQQLSQRNVVTWSALISGYAHNGLGDEALKCFEQMKSMGIDPNPVTYISVLKACGIVGSSELGKDIDAKLRKQGLLQIEDDVVLGTALVDMYAKCGEIERAREVFGEMSERNVVTWNALIAGLSQHGLGDEALRCFAEMKDAGICADERTYVSVLQACGIVGCLEIGEDVDAELRRRPWLWQRNLVLGTALVDMYARCGALEKAQEVLEELPEKNPAAWSALIAGYVEHGFDDNALQCFAQMKDAGIRRSTATYISVLKACGSVGSLAIGESVAEEIPTGLLQKDGVLGTALLDMYSKCGAPRKAREVFDRLLVQDDVSWNALIAGYGQLGQADAALRAYKLMRAEGVLPNRISFVLLLSACSHSGLLEEGQALLDEMSVCCSLAPTLEHFACLVDLFGRAGHFGKMKALLDEAPSSCHAPLLQSILASCRKWKNVELGRWAFDQLVKSDFECAYAYVCMGDIYAVSGTRREAYGIESF
jgi:pentatricopeptide repeat protein